MTLGQRAELERILEMICDGCHWPYVIEDQEEMQDKCDACRIPKALTKLCDKLSGTKKQKR